jgi:hypothetical protein
MSLFSGPFEVGRQGRGISLSFLIYFVSDIHRGSLCTFHVDSTPGKGSGWWRSKSGVRGGTRFFVAKVLDVTLDRIYRDRNRSMVGSGCFLLRIQSAHCSISLALEAALNWRVCSGGSENPGVFQGI